MTETTATEDDWIISSFVKRSFEQLTRCGCDLCMRAIKLKKELARAINEQKDGS